jgi:hypothetical protein
MALLTTPPLRRLPHTKGARMKQRSMFHGLRPPRQVLATAGRSPRVGTHARRRRRVWLTRGLAALVLSGLLLSVGALLGMAVPLRDAPHPIVQVVPPPHVIVVQEDTLPPVMQRIAQCESAGQQFARDGKVLRGKRHPQDTGLFQINAAVWAKQAEALGYDIHTRDGNESMARYLFANYGSVPWQSSAKCWSRAS